MEYRLRKAERKDAAAINALFMEMLRDVYGEAAVHEYGEDTLEAYFSGGENWICVAESAGKIVGFLAIEAHREEHNYLYYDDFCVCAQERNRGIGSALMDAAETYCKTLGFQHIVLHVEKTNVLARRLYQKRGFEVLREEERRICLIQHLT